VNIYIGPALLFPLLQAASSVEQIQQSLQLIHSSLKSSIPNLKYMMTIGYKTVAFLLSLKTKDLVDKLVMRSMFQLCFSSCHIKNEIQEDKGDSYKETKKNRAISRKDNTATTTTNKKKIVPIFNSNNDVEKSLLLVDPGWSLVIFSCCFGYLLLGCSVVSVSFIICMLTLLLMPLAGLHFCVELDFVTPLL
jgi:hypothetical protein